MHHAIQDTITIGMKEIIRVNIIGKDDQCFAFPLPRGASIFSSLANADGLVRVQRTLRDLVRAKSLTANS